MVPWPDLNEETLEGLTAGNKLALGPLPPRRSCWVMQSAKLNLNEWRPDHGIQKCKPLHQTPLQEEA
eukprot:3895871-Lingulodinium_polyedra.AAC.1